MIDLGNRWRELQAQERHEIERIMRSLSEAAGEAEHELVDAVERLARLDLALAKARLAEQLGAADLTEAGERTRPGSSRRRRRCGWSRRGTRCSRARSSPSPSRRAARRARC